jgi:hypothetical protein
LEIEQQSPVVKELVFILSLCLRSFLQMDQKIKLKQQAFSGLCVLGIAAVTLRLKNIKKIMILQNMSAITLSETQIKHQAWTFAARAFGYSGLALCLSGGAVLSSVCWMNDIQSVSLKVIKAAAFTAKSRTHIHKMFPFLKVKDSLTTNEQVVEEDDFVKAWTDAWDSTESKSVSLSTSNDFIANRVKDVLGPLAK